MAVLEVFDALESAGAPPADVPETEEMELRPPLEAGEIVMLLTTEQSYAALEKFGRYVTEACDECGACSVRYATRAKAKKACGAPAHAVMERKPTRPEPARGRGEIARGEATRIALL